ncbi:MAG: hypothetical protein IPJ74_01665 [Saprospiraceae bacterium]|nr:hypothetical protein [Saprospiraceae bacterium]
MSDVELDHFDGHYLGECDYRVIKRTFIARDECSGLSDYCDQYLYIRQPTMEDVVLPITRRIWNADRASRRLQARW